MTFLNYIMLAALAAVAIPILIHLLNRSRSQTVDWGAMRFLLAAMAARSRRIRIEELILMALRCLAVALLALAMARPFLPSTSTVPWALVLPAMLAAAVAAAAAAAMWSDRRIRWACLAAAGVLLLASGTATAWEQFSQQRRWADSGAGRDIAIVIDGSASMSLSTDGKKNFQRAIEEARAVVASCRPSDAVSLILAGGAIRPAVPNPTTNRDELRAALNGLAPAGGSMKVLEALNAAAASLAAGGNPGKKIVIITDGQSVGWDVRNEARWQFLAESLASMPTRPTVVCRALPLPASFRNAAVTDIGFARGVVGTDRPVRIDVKIANTGTLPITPAGVELSVDGQAPQRQSVNQILPNATETVRFDQAFKTTGRHVVAARIVGEDDMSADNADERVLDVAEKLDVLVIEGAPSVRPLDGAADCINLALAPGGDAPTALPQPASDRVENSVAPKVIQADQLAAIKDLSLYKAVVLANVPMLPDQAAARLAEYVSAGGGIMIALGDRARPEFYNRWTSLSGQSMAPAQLVRNTFVAEEQAARIDPKSFSHPALEILSDPGKSYVASAAVRSYWELIVNDKDPYVGVAARFANSGPLLVERRLGKGHVLMLATSLDSRHGNLPTLNCFVPLMHEIVYYLAAPLAAQGNVSAGDEVLIDLPARPAGAAAPPQATAGQVADVDVITPSGERREASIVSAGPQSARVRFSGADQPGLYRLAASPALQQRYQTAGADGQGLPFVVLSDPAESRMDALSEADMKLPLRHVDIQRVASVEELVSSVTGQIPGQELWQYLALGLLAALMGEIALTRWIAVQRRSHEVQTVSFGEKAVDVETFRDRARKKLKPTIMQKQGAADK